jgi:hypothetical protein
MKRWTSRSNYNHITLDWIGYDHLQVKRKRYDFLLKNEGVLEYPDDLNYRWEWIDQKVETLFESNVPNHTIDRHCPLVPSPIWSTREGSVSTLSSCPFMLFAVWQTILDL